MTARITREEAQLIVNREDWGDDVELAATVIALYDDNAAKDETIATLAEIAENLNKGNIPSNVGPDPVWLIIYNNYAMGSKPMSPRVAAWFEANKAGER